MIRGGAGQERRGVRAATAAVTATTPAAAATAALTADPTIVAATATAAPIAAAFTFAPAVAGSVPREVRRALVRERVGCAVAKGLTVVHFQLNLSRF
jgi:hypothetical protein